MYPIDLIYPVHRIYPIYPIYLIYLIFQMNQSINLSIYLSIDLSCYKISLPCFLISLLSI